MICTTCGQRYPARPTVGESKKMTHKILSDTLAAWASPDHGVCNTHDGTTIAQGEVIEIVYGKTASVRKWLASAASAIR